MTFLARAVISILLVLSTGLLPLAGSARVIENDPQGFYGIPWGQPLADRSEFVRIESEEHVDAYILKEAPPQLAGIQVESIKFRTHDNQFAQVTIHYRGKETHHSLLTYLESEYGAIQLKPGSMMRGLNQQYTWRGSETEISMTYRGLVERGFLAAESRVLAPRFMDGISDHSY